MDENVKIVKKEVEDLLEKVGVSADIEVTEADDEFNVLVDGHDDNALLIGRHGDTLSSLQTILGFIVAKKLGEYKRVILEVGGYRKDREEYLKNLCERLKEEVIESGREKIVNGLKPWERRVIHMYLGEDKDVVTESTGEGRDRVLVIKKRE
ncbi:KH domain-containing protein [Candidatus Parcubacteria bacterium]|nr:MAG: KH domain-containing protein [Candidatus Parcubacteria bacterium]